MTAEATPSSEKAQRVRVRFAREAEAAELGHLDITRAWERALLDAGIPVSFSQRKHPQPRLTIAAGLPVGVTSEGELLDVVLAERLRPEELAERVATHLPPGLRALDAWEVGIGLPSLPSSVRWADYEVDVQAQQVEVERAAATFLERETLPWADTRGEKVRRYDIRALVQDIRVAGEASCGGTRLTMRLRCDSAGVGRPEQVVKALGLPEPDRVHRTRLVLGEMSPARDAWRRRGRYRT
jgi:radical SAM-linked protein